MNKALQAFKYIFADFITSALAWLLFFLFRKIYIEYPYTIDWDSILASKNFWYGILFMPLFWISLFTIEGMYFNVYRKSRLKEISKVFITTILGSLVIFFVFILDDVQYSYTSYYKSIAFLFGAHFLLIGSVKFILSTIAAKKVHSRKIGFNSLIIGGGESAINLFQELESAKKSAGYKFLGFLNTEGPDTLSEYLPHLGSISEAKDIIQSKQIEEVIIAVESKEHNSIRDILLALADCNVTVKIIPDMYNILAGQVKMNSILHAALIEVNFGTMRQWEAYAKRTIDIVFSIVTLILGMPFLCIIALLVKFSSKGPIFFQQERIGLRGEPFKIIKFRSMYLDSEKNGPALSSDKDSRITPIGRFLRKSRIDETPQFFNVLIGEMSLVGPRPERQFFIDQIVEKAPEYKFLHKVKPGITSWGQVKYGYAENVDEMVARLKFDLIYMENMSLLVDFKIMIHTILVVFQGRGK